MFLSLLGSLETSKMHFSRVIKILEQNLDLLEIFSETIIFNGGSILPQKSPCSFLLLKYL